MEVRKNKDYYINRVRDSFLKISGFDLDTYLTFVKSFLEQIWAMNESDVNLVPFFSLFSELAEWDPSIFEVNSSSDRHCSLTVISERIHPDRVVDKTKEDSVLYPSVIESPFGKFSFDGNAIDLIKASFHEKITKQTSDDEIRNFFDKNFFRETPDNRKIPTESWYKLLDTLISRSPKNSWGVFAAGRYENICKDIAKSVTIGEYFILDRYSANRLDVVMADDQHEHEFEIQKIDELKDRIKAVVSKVRSFSKTIGLLLLNQSDPVSNCPIYVEGFRKHIAYSYSDSTLKDIYDIWPNVIEAVIAIAYIDFCFVSTPENVETLSAAYRRLERFGVGEEITEPNMAKALLLLQKCIFHHTNNVDDRKLEYNYLIHEREFQKFVTESNPLEIQKIKIDDDVFSPESKESKVDGHSDITDFNNIYYKYRIIKFNQKNVRKIVESGDYSDDKLKSLEKALDEDIWTVSLLTSAIVYISGDGCADVIRKHFVLSSLLNKLKELADLYGDERLLPGKIVRPFIRCYYTVTSEKGKYHIDEQNTLTDDCYENTVDAFDGRHSALIVSFLPTPVSINFLKLFIEKYDSLRKKYEIESNFEETRKKSVGLKKEIIAQLHTKELESTQKLLDKERSKSLQLLGILGSFIAFVSLAASSLNSVPPELFWYHMLACSGCIVLLILMIFVIALDNKWLKGILLTVLFLYIVISIYIGVMKSPHTSDRNQTIMSTDVSAGTKSASDVTTSSPVMLINGDVTVASEMPDTVRVNR